MAKQHGPYGLSRRNDEALARLERDYPEIDRDPICKSAAAMARIGAVRGSLSVNAAFNRFVANGIAALRQELELPRQTPVRLRQAKSKHRIPTPDEFAETLRAFARDVSSEEV